MLYDMHKNEYIEML